MAVMKRGLGRGLDALLDPLTEKKDSSETGKSVLEVDIHLIDNNKKQPRKSFDEEKLSELSESIKLHGIVQPLIVREKSGRYQIVAGERRFRAAKLASVKTVPVIVVDYDDEKLQEVSLIENIQRENLNPIEEASAVRFLMEQHDLTQEEVSKKLGKSRPAVANMLRLLQLSDEVLDMVRDGRLSAGHGRALAALTDRSLQLKLAEETVRMEYSVRALENRIKNLDEKKAKKKETVLSPEMKAFQKDLREKTGAKVTIQGTEKKGKIIIEYASSDDLQNIYLLLQNE